MPSVITQLNSFGRGKWLIRLIVNELVHPIWNQGLTLTWELIGTVLYLQVDLVSWTRLAKDVHCGLLHVLRFSGHLTNWISLV